MAFSFIGMPLYDWSGLVLDNRSMQTLHQAYQKLSHLAAIFRYLLNQASPTTEQGNICISKTESEKIKFVCLMNMHIIKLNVICSVVIFLVLECDLVLIVI